MVKVGIPRALAYYQYYPMWRTFFTELGAEVVISQPSTQKMLSEGAARVVADTCLPVKIFMGHVLTLADKCDFMFIPVIRSVKKKVYNCAKFLGLPDMTRAVIPECPPILDMDFDINLGMDAMYDGIYKIGKRFTNSKSDIKQAVKTAWEAYLYYRRLMMEMKLTPLQAISMIYDKTAPETIVCADAQPKTTIALIGHHYLIYDEHVNHRLIRRLEQAECRIVTPEMLRFEQLETATNRLVESTYWTWEEEVVGAGNYYLEAGGVDGIIGVAAFGCGPDSLMMDMVHRQAVRIKSMPFMNLTLEEHTADAGVLTRLEAFLDMIRRKQRRAECV